MSTLPARTLTSAVVDPSELYTKLIYEPVGAAPHESFEALNGGLDPANWAGQAPAWSIQYGAFAQGRWYGFDQHEFVYAKQIGGKGANLGTVIPERAVLSQLTATPFIPWDASVVMFGVEAFFQQDCTHWYHNQTQYDEFWDYRIEFNGSENNAMYGRLPSSRFSTNAPSGGVDPGYAVETRWRHVTKMGMVKNVPKGHNMVRVSLWAGVFNPDDYTSKVAIPTGGVWVLAIR